MTFQQAVQCPYLPGRANDTEWLLLMEAPPSAFSISLSIGADWYLSSCKSTELRNPAFKEKEIIDGMPNLVSLLSLV